MVSRANIGASKTFPPLPALYGSGWRRCGTGWRRGESKIAYWKTFLRSAKQKIWHSAYGLDEEGDCQPDKESINTSAAST